MTGSSVDRITASFIQSALMAAADEMFAVLKKTAMSPMIYELLAMGRSRQALSRIKGSLDRKEVRRLSVKLNIRITEDEHADFQAVAEASGLTVSEAVRHLVRQASDRLAIQSDELDAIAAARRELSVSAVLTPPSC